jgi:hypothetical protein
MHRLLIKTSPVNQPTHHIHSTYTPTIHTQHATNQTNPSLSSPPIILPPPPAILHNHPLPLRNSPRQTGITLISNTPTPPPLHPLLIHISLLLPPRRPFHIPISIIFRCSLRRTQSDPLPLAFNIHFFPSSTPMPTLLPHTNTTRSRPRRRRSLFYAHKLNRRRRRWG